MDDGPTPWPFLQTAIILTAGLAAVAPAASGTPSARAGYPKLFRCASPVAEPEDRPGLSPACRRWREGERRALAALPPAARRARIRDLRDSMGLRPDEGMTGDGRDTGTIGSMDGPPRP